MTNLFIKPITQTNWEAATALTVHSHQADFVPSVAISLAKAYIRPNGFCYDPYGIYRPRLVGAELIGFYSCIHLPDDLSFCYFGGFLIDHRFQGRGYGKASLGAFLADVRQRYRQCQEVLLSVHPDNHIAAQLYTAHGFVKTGDWLDQEEEMRLSLTGGQ